MRKEQEVSQAQITALRSAMNRFNDQLFKDKGVFWDITSFPFGEFVELHPGVLAMKLRGLWEAPTELAHLAAEFFAPFDFSLGDAFLIVAEAGAKVEQQYTLLDFEFTVLKGAAYFTTYSKELSSGRIDAFTPHGIFFRLYTVMALKFPSLV